jgi:hypothetical protein
MYLFKRLSDLRKVPPDHPCRGFVLKLVRSIVFSRNGYDPSTDGYAVLIEPREVLRELIGKPKRIQGYDKWRVPLIKVDEFMRINSAPPATSGEKSDF